MDKNVKFTIADAAKEILESYPYLDEFLQEECVNFSQLAEKIMPQIKKLTQKKEVQKQAVVMGIIRYSQNLKSEKLSKSLLKIIADSTITLKTDMEYLNIPKTVANLKILENTYSKIDWNKNEIFFIVQGINEISVVIDKSNYKELKNKLNKEEIEKQYSQTSILVVHSPPEAAGPGIINMLTKPIAKAGISIEILSLTRDTIFLTDEKNASRLFQILKELIDKCRNQL